jgi:hypothetical protein
MRIGIILNGNNTKKFSIKVIKKNFMIRRKVDRKKTLINTHYKQYLSFFKILQFKWSMFFAPKIFGNYQIMPSFSELKDTDIHLHTGINPKWTYRNSIMWTPRFYIKKDLSSEFLFELKKFRKLIEWTDLHQVALVQLILTEAIRDTTYEIAYNYKVESTNSNLFHGLIDILIYNNDPESQNQK